MSMLPKEGDIVRGPSLHDPDTVRMWKVLRTGAGTLAAAQNTAARKPYRHIIDLTKCEKVS